MHALRSVSSFAPVEPSDTTAWRLITPTSPQAGPEPHVRREQQPNERHGERREHSSWVGYAYDEAHGLIAVEDNLGNSIEYELDVHGSRAQEGVARVEAKLGPKPLE